MKVTVEFLYKQQDELQENALVLFLRVLRDHQDPHTACHQDLVELAIEIERLVSNQEVRAAPRVVERSSFIKSVAALVRATLLGAVSALGGALWGIVGGGIAGGFALLGAEWFWESAVSSYTISDSPGILFFGGMLLGLIVGGIGGAVAGVIGYVISKPVSGAVTGLVLGTAIGIAAGALIDIGICVASEMEFTQNSFSFDMSSLTPIYTICCMIGGAVVGSGGGAVGSGIGKIVRKAR